ncbi:MAG: hypothetical protein ACYC7A_09935 [Thermoanaerobaculia bacterium]
MRRIDTAPSAAALASAGSHSLALFNRCMWSCGPTARGDVFGQVIYENGATGPSFPVAVSGRFEEGKAAFWAGEFYLAIYTVRDAAFAVRIAPDGAVGEPIEIASAPNPIGGFLAIRGDDRIFVTWHYQRDSGDRALVARLLRIDGEPLSDTWILREDGAYVLGGGAKGNQFFLVGGRESGTAPLYRDVIAGPVAERSAWEPYVVPEAGTVSRAPLVETGDGYVLLWKTGYQDGEGEIRATDLGATAPGATWSLGIGANAAPVLENPANDALVVYNDAVRYLAFTFNPETDRDGPVVPFPLTEPKSNIRSYPLPMTAWDGKNVELLWSEDRLSYWGPTRMKFVEINPATRIATAEKSIGASPEVQESPAVARGRSMDLAVWLTYHPDTATTVVDASRLVSGSPLEVDGIRLSTSDAMQHSVSVASNGSVFLVVWQEERPNATSRILACRVAEYGSAILLDPEPIVIAENAMTWYSGATDVVWAGDQFLVTWTSGESTPYWTNHTIMAARVRGDGSVLDPGGFELVPNAEGSEREAQLAYDGESVLVAWTGVFDRRVGRYNQPLLRANAMLVSNDGTPRSPVLTISDVSEWESAPKVAFNGESYLVTWGAADRATEGTDVYGSIVTRGGTIVGAPTAGGRLRPVRLGMHLRPPSQMLIAEGSAGHSIAGIDGGWLVAWETAGSDRDNDVVWRVVNQDGSLTGIAPVAPDPKRGEGSPALDARDDEVTIVYASVQRIMNRRAYIAPFRVDSRDAPAGIDRRVGARRRAP